MPIDLQSRQSAGDLRHLKRRIGLVPSWISRNAPFVFWTIYLALTFIGYVFLIRWLLS